MKILNISKNTLLADSCRVADTFFTRFKGLMGAAFLPAGAGLHIIPCNSIHMFFMKIPLDVVFLDRNNTVVHMVEGIRPWQATKIVRKAHSVLELPAGTINSSRTSAGDRLKLEIN